ncbi:precorrin-2 dehydrogenase/sirohydrochlorin ferrochelatase family protein [Desulfofundulus thermocisternus]|uniref:precorrin-2 dehydrogenase/sirohydrochlorin ferrochelatase family protein n=1 Tax=Desulfofundulus thermocisternus TaxID=42471 RepID=UPI00217DB2CD|nr:bifunctional precorrin-2 dehydrogenase/sirohydrochlorin ferrochelatase [Desulfofundulus thermocisternus]MCS5696378.1 bifunctional precorrin-2 dehydrogenase/sirohydrochlorin ferrochelatase [Desulfofundulus thermocisternus]
MPRTYPISLILSQRPCLVVGGGSVAERKVLSLLACGAKVKVVSPSLTPALQDLASKDKINYRRGTFEIADLENMFLVIAATDREEVNHRIATEAMARNMLVNVVDDPPYGNFYVPAVLRRGSLQIAISTDGKSPLIARKIKEELEERYGPEYGILVDLLGEIRHDILNKITDPRKRRELLEAIVDDETLQLLAGGELEKAKERVINAYHRSRSKP